MRTFKKYLGFISILILATSCSYENMETLYPQEPGCDTINVSYTEDIKPIFDANCVSCHSGSAPAGGYSFEDYSLGSKLRN